jgi:hypothetical protein
VGKSNSGTPIRSTMSDQSRQRELPPAPPRRLGNNAYFFSAISSLDILTLRSFSELVHSHASKKEKTRFISESWGNHLYETCVIDEWDHPERPRLPIYEITLLFRKLIDPLRSPLLSMHRPIALFMFIFLASISLLLLRCRLFCRLPDGNNR